MNVFLKRSTLPIDDTSTDTISQDHIDPGSSDNDTLHTLQNLILCFNQETLLSRSYSSEEDTVCAIVRAAIVLIGVG